MLYSVITLFINKMLFTFYFDLQMFSHCQRLVQQIRSRSVHGKQMEQKLAQNIVASLARSLQEMSINFRRSQSAYLKSEDHYYTIPK